MDTDVWQSVGFFLLIVITSIAPLPAQSSPAPEIGAHGRPYIEDRTHFLLQTKTAMTTSCEIPETATEARVSYVPPFERIKNKVQISAVKGELRATASYEDLLSIIKQMLISITVDSEWYLKKYPDVADAINAGEFKSARAHFVEHGYIEGRLPGPIVVDEQWYFDQYPDVAESVRRGAEASAQSHFDRDGYKEGRLPFPL